MLEPGTRVRPNDEEVAAKVMDGEAIMINLATGSYYAMADAGGLIWESIEQHCSIAEIADRVSGAYEVSGEAARADVLALARELLELGIIKVSEHPSAVGAPPPPPPTRHPYERPALSAFSDMRNLLALDPPVPTLDALKRRDPQEEPQA